MKMGHQLHKLASFFSDSNAYENVNPQNCSVFLLRRLDFESATQRTEPLTDKCLGHYWPNSPKAGAVNLARFRATT